VIKINKTKTFNFSKEIESKLKQYEKNSNFDYDKQSKDNYIIERLKYAPGFARIYLHMCRSIKNKVVMFGVKEISEKLNIPLNTVYRTFKFLLDRKEVSKNNLTSVTKYVIAVPIDEFVTERRINIAISRLD